MSGMPRSHRSAVPGRTSPASWTLRGALAVGALTALVACRDFFILPTEEVSVDASDASPSSGCRSDDPNEIFCEDFDGPSFNPAWDVIPTSFVELDRSTFLSPPASLHVDVPTPLSMDTAAALVRNITAPATANVRVDVSLRIDREGSVYPFGIICGPTGYSLALRLVPSLISEIDSDTDFGSYPFDAPLSAGPWRRLSLLVRRGAGTVSLLVDGQEVLPETKLKGAAELLSDCRLFFGLFFAAKSASWGAHYDDLVMRTF